MKKVVLSTRTKLMALDAARMPPEGLKGSENIRTCVKLQGKLEDGFTEAQIALTGRTELSEEDKKKEYVVYLDLNEYNFLKRTVEGIPWNGIMAKEALALVESLENAVDYDPPTETK